MWMVAIEASLRSATLPTTCRRLRIRLDLEQGGPPDGTAVLPRWTQVPIHAALAVARRWPAGDTCLRRCLLVGHRIRELGPVLRIGVRRDEHGAFRAHAWLEIDGRTLDAGAEGFTTLRTTAR